jgi:hypothetical protein
MPPFSMMYLKAKSMSPPSHEWSPSAVEQSISCCSENEVSVLPAICQAPSVEPVVENDQHEPHWPWFLTGVTAPLVRQSTVSSGADVSSQVSLRGDDRLYVLVHCFLNSSLVMSVNWLCPIR